MIGFNDKMIFWGGELQKNYEMEIDLNIKSKNCFKQLLEWITWMNMMIAKYNKKFSSFKFLN